MTAPTCQDCRFWKLAGSQSGNPVGICRRYPPQVLAIPSQNRISGDMHIELRSQATMMAGGEWCGEHQPAAVVSSILEGAN